jgi:hypothetical protein
VSWRNLETGSAGTVTPLRTFRAADGWRLELERPARAA